MLEDVEYVDTVGAAALVGLHPHTLVYYRCVGKGPRYLKRGRNILYRPNDVKSWMASRLQEVDPQTRAVDPVRSERAKERMRARRAQREAQ